MLDAAKLLELGWSEELIQELTRTAAAIRDTSPELPQVERPSSFERVVSSSEMLAASAVPNSGPSLFVRSR